MNKIIPYLKKAEALPNYRLSLEFEDGISGIVDLSEWKEKEFLYFGMMKKSFMILK